MPSDRTRTSDDLLQRYKAVVMQQGRVIVDRDINALQEIVDGLISSIASESIGVCGTPDDGFRISIQEDASAASPPPTFSSPDPWDFLISPGTIYVGGQRVVLPPMDGRMPPSAANGSWTFSRQPNWIDRDSPTPVTRSHSSLQHEFVYLDVREQEVGAIEDPDLQDVALGGPDTTQRVRLMWRVRRMPVDATDGATALDAAQSGWNAHGLSLDPTTMRLIPQVQIKVGFPSTQRSSGPCDPVVDGGYLGAENQLLRVQLANAKDGSIHLLWGYDNASFLYRVRPLNPQIGTTFQLLQTPLDAYHAPKPGQVVEVLRATTILGVEPDQSLDPSGRSIVRCVAESNGHLTEVACYDGGDNTLVLNTPLPANTTGDPSYPLFLRVWQGMQPFSLSSPKISLADPVTSLPLGIEVTVSVPAGGASGGVLPTGSFWMIAVRPGTPQAVYPQRFLGAPQWPDGPRHWICPLALINWIGQPTASTPGFSAPASVTDLRHRFANLVELTDRRWDDQLNVNDVFTLGKPAIRVSNGSSLGVNDLAQGLGIHLNQNIDPASATEAACSVSLLLPFVSQISGQGQSQPVLPVSYQPLVLAAKVSPADPAFITWVPTSTRSTSSSQSNWHDSLEILLPQQVFGNENDAWVELPPPSTLFARWLYVTATGAAQFKSNAPATTTTPQMFTAISSKHKIKPGVKTLSARVSSTLSGVEAGIIFNYQSTSAGNPNPSYWFFAISPLPVVGSTPSIVLTFIQTGSSPLGPFIASNPIGPFPAIVDDIEFRINQTPGGTLTFFVNLGDKSIGPLSFPTAPGLPNSFLIGSSVGLALSAGSVPSIQVEFPAMELDYDGIADILLPADFRSQAILTVNRNFLRPQPGVASPPIPAHRPDYSVWFWLLPSDTVVGSQPASTASFSRQ